MSVNPEKLMTNNQHDTVLVADDHGLYRSGFGFLLRDRMGFRSVIEAATFDAALDRLAETPNVELALFDLAMPGISGPEGLSGMRPVRWITIDPPGLLDVWEPAVDDSWPGFVVALDGRVRAAADPLGRWWEWRAVPAADAS